MPPINEFAGEIFISSASLKCEFSYATPKRFYSDLARLAADESLSMRKSYENIFLLGETARKHSHLRCKREAWSARTLGKKKSGQLLPKQDGDRPGRLRRSKESPHYISPVPQIYNWHIS